MSINRSSAHRRQAVEEVARADQHDDGMVAIWVVLDVELELIESALRRSNFIVPGW